MAEIEIRNEKLGNLLQEVEDLISKLEGVKEDQRASMIKDIDALMKQADTCYTYIDLEHRRLGQSERAEWKQTLREWKSKVNDIKREMKFQRSARGAGGAAAGPAAARDPALINSDDMIAHGDKLQNESLAATERIQKQMQQVLETGAATAEQLEAQTQQLQGIYDDLYEIDDQLERANKIVKRMLRRTFTDKYMWCLIGLVFIAIVALVALKATGDKSVDTNLPDGIEQK